MQFERDFLSECLEQLAEAVFLGREPDRFESSFCVVFGFFFSVVREKREENKFIGNGYEKHFKARNA